jgi:hypothetical protein
VLFILLFFTACNKANEEPSEKETTARKLMTFDRAKWNAKDSDDYLYRDKMLASLMIGDTLNRLNRKEVLELLGEPDRSDGSYLFYTVRQERISFFPLHTKTLVLKLSNNGKVKSILIHE